MNISEKVEALERLSRLHASGTLSSDEYAAEKMRLMAEPLQTTEVHSQQGVDETRAEAITSSARWPLQVLAALALLSVGGAALWARQSDEKEVIANTEDSVSVNSAAEAAATEATSEPSSADVASSDGYVRLTCENRYLGERQRLHLEACKGTFGKITILENSMLVTYGPASTSDSQNIDRLYERFPDEGDVPALLFPVHLESYFVQAQWDGRGDTDQRFVMEVLDGSGQVISTRKNAGFLVACAGAQFDSQCRLPQNGSFQGQSRNAKSGIRNEVRTSMSAEPKNSGLNEFTDRCGRPIEVKDGAFVYDEEKASRPC